MSEARVRGRGSQLSPRGVTPLLCARGEQALEIGGGTGRWEGAVQSPISRPDPRTLAAPPSARSWGPSSAPAGPGGRRRGSGGGDGQLDRKWAGPASPVPPAAPPGGGGGAGAGLALPSSAPVWNPGGSPLPAPTRLRACVVAGGLKEGGTVGVPQAAGGGVPIKTNIRHRKLECTSTQHRSPSTHAWRHTRAHTQVHTT